MKYHFRSRAAFTLVELLVVAAIITVLATVVTIGSRLFVGQARETKEISNGRALITAYLTYAADHDGELMPGFGDFPAKDDLGAELSAPKNQRYPWRLAPYLQNDLGVLWNTKHEEKLRAMADQDHDAYVYAVSVQPAFGINATFVGGDYQNLPPNKPKVRQKFGNFCVTRLGQATSASSLIVFATAAADFQGKRLNGYFVVDAPNMTGKRWKASFNPKAPPSDYGNVDFRHDGRAVVAMLDGHVESRPFDYLNDMRLWANPAAEADDRSWTLGKE